MELAGSKNIQHIVQMENSLLRSVVHPKSLHGINVAMDTLMEESAKRR